MRLSDRCSAAWNGARFRVHVLQPTYSSPSTVIPGRGRAVRDGRPRLTPATIAGSVRRRMPPRVRRGFDLGQSSVRDALADRVLSLAAEAAFWTMLSLPPLVLGLLGLVGYITSALDPDVVERVEASVLSAAGEVLAPQAVNNLVAPLISSVLERGYASVASLGFVLSLWSGSAAMSAYVRTITVAYDMPHLRQAWKGRLLAFALYVGGVVVSAILVPLLVFGPRLAIDLVPTQSLSQVAEVLLEVAYWPAVAILSLGALTSLYHLSVPVRTPWRRDVPGAALAMVLWLLGSYGLRAYLGSTTKYGVLTAPIAALLFFYVSGLAVLLGAELNAEIDKMWPTRRTTEARERSARGHDNRRGEGAAPVR